MPPDVVLRYLTTVKPGLFSNLKIYDRIGGLYDVTLGFCSHEVRQEAAKALTPEADGRLPDERLPKLLIVGVGSGLDLEYLPANLRGTGIDLSGGMLERARKRRAEFGMRDLDLRIMDARFLDFPDGSFEAVYLPLILTVATDGARVLAEAGRVVEPGGRVVISDRFWPEEKSRPKLVRAASWMLGHVAMRFDHRLSEMLSGAPLLQMEVHERVGPRDFFHLVTLRKPGNVPE